MPINLTHFMIENGPQQTRFSRGIVGFLHAKSPTRGVNLQSGGRNFDVIWDNNQISFRIRSLRSVSLASSLLLAIVLYMRSSLAISVFVDEALVYIVYSSFRFST